MRGSNIQAGYSSIQEDDSSSAEIKTQQAGKDDSCCSSCLKKEHSKKNNGLAHRWAVYVCCLNPAEPTNLFKTFYQSMNKRG